MPYAIELSREAEADIDALYHSDRKLFHRIINKTTSLEESPHEGKPLVGNHKGEFSLRIGDCCLVYKMEPTSHTIFVLTIKHRKIVYR